MTWEQSDPEICAETLKQAVKSALGYLSSGLCDSAKEACPGCAFEVQCAIAILEKAAKNAGI